MTYEISLATVPGTGGSLPHSGLVQRSDYSDLALVALHSDFDWWIIARNEFWQVGGIDGEIDGSGDAGLSCDEAGFFER
jgi:hypothetical protein